MQDIFDKSIALTLWPRINREFISAEPVHGEWSEQAIDKFEELAQVAQWNKLTARVNGYLLRQKVRAKRGNSPVPDVDLYDIKDDQDINVAEEMVKAGHAVFKKEELPAGEIQ